MNAITMNETQAQRDAERVREHAPKLLEACQTFVEWLDREDAGFVCAGKRRDTPEGEAEWHEWFMTNIALCRLAQDQAREAIEYATGAHDPGEYPEAGYEVDAAGTALG